MGFLDAASKVLPSITEPKVHLNFKQRLKWTGIILFIFLILGEITVYGVAPSSFEQFQFLQMILGSNMGSLMTLGIGPIVTASIILQLLVGSKIIPWNLKTQEGKIKFQSTQKILTILFAVFEAFGYVMFGAVKPVSPDIGTLLMVVGQIAFGGIIVMFMDEVVTKWGIGSGVSLFIAAGVSRGIFIGALNPCAVGAGCVLGDPAAGVFPFGRIPQLISFLQIGDFAQGMLAILPVIATVVVFLIVVYLQAIRVEIPLAFGSFRGFSRRWPLKFIYTSNMPVILTAALLANLQLMGMAFAGRAIPLLGTFNEAGQAVGGLIFFLGTPSSPAIHVFSITMLLVIFAAGFLVFFLRHKKSLHILFASIGIGVIAGLLVSNTFIGLPAGSEFLQLIGHTLFLGIGSMIFSMFWVSTSGMDARSVSEQIQGMGMQIPGFRRDPRIVEAVLNRYIPILALLGGLVVGLLASIANLTGALGTGTGILLTVMIIFQFYEQISQQYVEDMHPSVRKFFSK